MIGFILRRGVETFGQQLVKVALMVLKCVLLLAAISCMLGFADILGRCITAGDYQKDPLLARILLIAGSYLLLGVYAINGWCQFWILILFCAVGGFIWSAWLWKRSSSSRSTKTIWAIALSLSLLTQVPTISIAYIIVNLRFLSRASKICLFLLVPRLFELTEPGWNLGYSFAAVHCLPGWAASALHAWEAYATLPLLCAFFIFAIRHALSLPNTLLLNIATFIMLLCAPVMVSTLQDMTLTTYPRSVISQASPSSRCVVFVRRNLKKDHVVSARDVAERWVEEKELPANSIQDANEVIGRQVGCDIKAGHPVLRSSIHDLEMDDRDSKQVSN